MSTVSISYGSLKDASNEAKDVAKKLRKYSDSIYDSVYKKLDSYDGAWSSNLSSAKDNCYSKRSELENEADHYEKYAEKLIDLKDACHNTDKSVRSSVSTLTASFKETHGIRNSAVENAISYFFTSVGNSTSAGRWLGDAGDKYRTGRDYIKQAIKDWYNFEGGKEWLKGTLLALLEIAAGVLLLIGAIMTGGTLLAIIVGVVSNVIAIADGITNFVNEQRALFATMGDDPATGRRKSSLNTLTDTIRAESDNQILHGVANRIDDVSFICTVVSVGCDIGKLLKKGYKWATGSLAKLKDIGYKKVLSGEGLLTLGKKTITTFIDGFKDMKVALRTKDWQYFKDIAFEFKSDFISNFKVKFLNFKTVEGRLSSAKGILGITKGLLKGGTGFKNLSITAFFNIALPCISIADLPIAPGEEYKAIVADDIYKIGDKINTKVFNNKIFKNDSVIDSEVLRKLLSGSNVNISIPDIYLPDIYQPGIHLSDINLQEVFAA